MRPVHATLVERVRSVSATCGIFLALCVAPAIAATPTTTTLAVGPSNNVATGTTVTLTATVTNPSPVTTGLVLFCNATAPHCSQGVGLYGTASLTTSGTAILRMRFGAGVANIQAQFVATSANAASASLTNSVAVTALPSYASVTSLGKTGVMGNYTLTGTVGGLGLNLVSGTVSFLDTTNGNANIGSAVLGSNSTGWAAPVPYATGNAPTGSTVGDLNRDGILDLAECDYYDGTVSVFLGNGDGTFGARTSYAVGVNPYQVLAGDFNRDGNLDLAVATTTGVSVLFGNGDGTFQSSVSYVITGGSTGIVVADFNGDGFLDLALVNNSQSTLNIMLGNGDGTFQSSVSYPTGKNGTAIAGGDFVGNGIQDLAVTNGTDGTVSVFIGNGDGTFKPQVTYAAGRWPDGITAGDVNNDGKLDLVSANYSDNTVSVYIGNGDGTFQPQVTYPAAGALAVLVADLNGDGNPDLAVINYASTGTVTIYPGNGTGVFNTSTAFPSGKYPGWVSAGDFNGDGRTDLAIPNDSTSVNTISILLGTSTAPFSAGSIAVTGTQGVHNVLASFPGDASHTGSQSPTVALTAPLGPVSVVVTSNNNPSADGSAVILTATLTGSGVNPTGTVQFRDGGSLLTTKAISGSIATYSTGFLAPGTHSITAVYGGNSNYVATTSAALTQVVSLITPTVSVSCSPNPITYGPQNTTCTATVTPSGATGTIAFTANGGAWTTVALSGGSASAGGWSTWAVGTYPVGATYSGDSNYSGSSASSTVTIAPAPTTTTITSTLNPSVFGQNVSWPCSVTSPDGTPTGTITYTNSNGTSGDVTLIGGVSGSNTWSGTGLPVGTYVFGCSFAAQGNFAASSSSVTQTVGPAPTITELSSSSNPIVFGGSTTFTALLDTGGIPTPTGTVAFTSNGVSIGSGAVSTVSATNLERFSNSPSSWSYVSEAVALNSTVAPDGTNTATLATVNSAGGYYLYDGTIACSPGPITYSLWLQKYSTSPTDQVAMGLRFFDSVGTELMGNSISVVPTAIWQRHSETYTAPTGTTSCAITVETYNYSAPQFPTGAGAYVWGAQVEQATSAGPYIATSGASATGNGGIATLTTTTLPVGSDSIVAVYSGDASTLTSTSSGLIEMVTPDASAVTLTSSGNPANYGVSVVFTAQTAAAATGTITFLDGATSIGSGTVSGGVATFTTNALGTGTHNITASYGGDTDYSPAASAALSEVITRTAATVSMASTFSPSTYGQSVTFTFTATGVLGTPSGTVAISDGATLLATPTLNASGVATYTTANLTVGSHTLTAVYGGDANYK